MQVSFNCYCSNIRAIWLILIFKGSIDCLLNSLSCLQKPVDSYVILWLINLLVIYQSLVSTALSQENDKREHSHIAWAKCLPPTSPNSLWLKFNTLSLKFTFNNHTKIHKIIIMNEFIYIPLNEICEQITSMRFGPTYYRSVTGYKQSKTTISWWVAIATRGQLVHNAFIHYSFTIQVSYIYIHITVYCIDFIKKNIHLPTQQWHNISTENTRNA